MNTPLFGMFDFGPMAPSTKPGSSEGTRTITEADEPTYLTSSTSAIVFDDPKRHSRLLGDCTTCKLLTSIWMVLPPSSETSEGETSDTWAGVDGLGE